MQAIQARAPVVVRHNCARSSVPECSKPGECGLPTVTETHREALLGSVLLVREGLVKPNLRLASEVLQACKTPQLKH